MIPLRVVLIGGFQAIFGYTTGYHSSAFNPLEPWIKNLINQSSTEHFDFMPNESAMAWFWSSIAASYTFGALVAALLMHYPVQYWGKRNTVMILRNAVLIIACAILIAAKPWNSIEMLYLGRFFAGMAHCVSGLITVLLVECTPIKYAGIVSYLSRAAHTFWNMIGVLAGLAQTDATEENWNFRFFIPLAFGLVHMMGIFFLPNSPKYMYIIKDDENKAKKAFHFFHGSNADWEAEKKHYDQEKRLANESKAPSLKEMLKTSHMRWPLILCMVAAASPAFGGCDVVLHYSVGILRQYDLTEKQLGLISVLGLYLPGVMIGITCSLLINKIGRRRLFLIMMGFNQVSMILLVVSGYLEAINKAAGTTVAVIALFVMWLTVAGGLSMIHAIMPGELCLQSCSSRAASLSFFTDWTISTLALFSYPLLRNLIGPLALSPLIFCGVATFIFMYFYLPESTGKTVDEIIKENWVEKKSPKVQKT